MTGRWGVIVLGALLFSCDDRAGLLQQEYERAESPAAQCEIASKIADAFLEAGDEENYRRWSQTRELDCLYAGALRDANLR